MFNAKSLDKKWKELVYAMAGIGPNLLMILMTAYFTDALNPSGLKADIQLWSITGTILISTSIFPLLWTIAKVFDGIIDIPLASLTDNLKTKWGRRRPTIAVCLLPMAISYLLCWIVPFDNQLGNTIWIFIWGLVFFTTYTMCLISYYGSLSTVCYDENQRLRVSSYKAIFDTIGYALAYAAIPALLKPLNIRIDQLAIYCIPLMLSMLIPLFMIKEGDKFEKKCQEEGIDFKPLADDPHVSIGESIKLTLKNKLFLKWLLVNACTFFGLQMFLVSQNAIISGVMNLGTKYSAILNTCAFAPVPLMLILFQKVKAKKGIRFTFQTCLLSFGIAILSFLLASEYVCGDNVTLQVTIAAIGGVIGSWAIGAFFMMPYMIPAQISSVEEKLTGKNHSAMYFAAQAVATSIVGAISGTLIYEFIKKWTVDVDGVEIKAGVMLVPVIVALTCIIGFFLCFLMPKDFTTDAIAKELGLKKELEQMELNQITMVDTIEEKKTIPFEEESNVINVFLWFLSISVYGIIWRFTLMSNINKVEPFKKYKLHWILSILIPPYAAVAAYITNKRLVALAKQNNVIVKDNSIICCILSLLFLNIITYCIMQKSMNKIAAINQ